MIRTVLAGLLCAGVLLAPISARGDDKLDEYRQREKVAAQKLEQETRDAIVRAKALKDDAPAAMKVLDDALNRLKADTAMGIAQRAELRVLVEGAIKDVKSPKRNERPSLLDRLPPTKNEQDAKIKAEIETILRLQKEGKSAEAQDLTGKLVADHPTLLSVDQTKEVVARSAAVKSDREVQEAKSKGFESQMTGVHKSSNPGEGDYQIDPERWRIAKEREKKLAEKISPKTPREKELLKWLASLIPNPITIKDMPLQQAQTLIEQELGTGLQINKRTLDELRLDYSTPVTVIVPRGSSRRAVLTALLDQLGMTFIIKNEMVTIMSKEEASRTLVTRVFPVDGLIGGPAGNPSADGVIKFIEDNIESDSWKSHGGSGTITWYPGANCLIVRNTAAVISNLEKQFYAK